MTFIVGMDIGGTHTDAVLIERRHTGVRILATAKTPTTSPLEHGVETVLHTLLAHAGVSAPSIAKLFIGTTHAVNALLEGERLYRVGVLRLGKPFTQSLAPCVRWPHKLRHALLAGCALARGGYECDGREIAPLDESEIAQAIDALLAQGAEGIAVCGIFSFLNPDQELRVKALVQARAGTTFPITLSHEVGGAGFMERENATILNCALKRVMEEGFGRLQQVIAALGCTAPVAITQNNGCIVPLERAMQFPVLTIASGPTNSFIGGGKLSGLEEAIVVDIGGTSTDVGMLKSGFPRRSQSRTEVAGISLNASMPDVLTIGLGGGSHVSLAPLSIGPKSAGHRLFQEGIVFGGNQLTFTDISVHLNAVQIPGTDPTRLTHDQPASMQVMRQALRHIEALVHKAITEARTYPVVLVGGGARLLPRELLPEHFCIPAHADVANAYGAALAEIAGTVDTVVSLTEREATLAKLKQQAHDLAVRDGADPARVRIVRCDITPYHYIPGDRARVCITAVGSQRGG